MTAQRRPWIGAPRKIQPAAAASVATSIPPDSRDRGVPEIARFFGIWIGMNFREHPPPHFHVWYSGQEGSVDIRTLRLTEGHLSPRVLGLVLEWASIHQADLMANWALAQRRLPLNKISPLT